MLPSRGFSVAHYVNTTAQLRFHCCISDWVYRPRQGRKRLRSESYSGNNLWNRFGFSSRNSSHHTDALGEESASKTDSPRCMLLSRDFTHPTLTPSTSNGRFTTSGQVVTRWQHHYNGPIHFTVIISNRPLYRINVIFLAIE